MEGDRAALPEQRVSAGQLVDQLAVAVEVKRAAVEEEAAAGIESSLAVAAVRKRVASRFSRRNTDRGSAR